MKQFKHINILLLAFTLGLAMLFTTCKKYPEDKFYSLKRPEKRVCGSWKVIEYDFNNNDIIYELNSKLKTFDIRNLTLNIVGKNGKSEGYCFLSPYFNSGIHDFPIFKSQKSVFYFNYHSGNLDFGDSLQKILLLTPLSFKGANYANWDIKNLYKNKMHLQLKTDSGNYDIYFEK